MYEGHKLCEDLDTSTICLVVEQYSEGKFMRAFHTHVPKSRLSHEARSQLLRALVVSFSRMGPESIVNHYVNRRGKEPPTVDFMWQTTYPEPGVLRTYCGTNTKAWSDEVICKSKFRPQPNALRDNF